MMYTLNIVLFCQLYLNKAETNKQIYLIMWNVYQSGFDSANTWNAISSLPLSISLPFSPPLFHLILHLFQL